MKFFGLISILIFLLYGCQSPYAGSGYSTSSSSTWSSNYSSYTPVKENVMVSNQSACNIKKELKDMTFGECMYEAGISYKECKANIDYASSTIKLPTDCNSRNSGSRS